jgi:hypothetical protein
LAGHGLLLVWLHGQPRHESVARTWRAATGLQPFDAVELGCATAVRVGWALEGCGMTRFNTALYMGRRYGRLLVVDVDVDLGRKSDRFQLICRCECGQKTTVSVRNLQKGNTKSCGCLQGELRVAVGIKNMVHGGASTGVLSGGETSIYASWRKVLIACYLGQKKGVHRVCHEFDPRWLEFENFLADFGRIKVSETISRLDKQLPWSKENCFINIGRRVLIGNFHE